MANEFAKLFTDDEYGQIVVMREEDDEGRPALRYYMNLNGKVGTCSIGASWREGEEEKVDEIFSKVDQNKAVNRARQLAKLVGVDDNG